MDKEEAVPSIGEPGSAGVVDKITILRQKMEIGRASCRERV